MFKERLNFLIKIMLISQVLILNQLMIMHLWIRIIRRLTKVSTDENYPSNKDKSTHIKELRKLKKKYYHLDNFVPNKESTG